MKYFKIKNNTNKLSKRDENYNKPINFTYVDGLNKKNATINPGFETYIMFQSLPISLQKHRLNNTITLVEISEKEFYLSNNMKKNEYVIEDEKNTKDEKKTTKKEEIKKPIKSKKNNEDNSEEIENISE